jgi:hypothetical protein
MTSVENVCVRTAKLKLARPQHHEGAGFEHFNSSSARFFRQHLVFGAGIQNDAPGLGPENLLNQWS